MSRLSIALALIIPTSASASARAADAAPTPADVAARLWAMTDAVLDRHVEPPARQEMLLFAVRGLFAAAKEPAPRDVARVVSATTSETQFADYLKSVWPRHIPADGPDGVTFDDKLAEALFKAVPGGGAYVRPDELRAIRQVEGNRYVGIGITIRWDKDKALPQIMNPFRRGTAYQAGVRAEDYVVQVDGKETKGIGLPKVIDWLRGDEGTTVIVVVRGPKASDSRTYALKRQPVPFDSLYGYRRSGDGWDYRLSADSPVAYVRMSAVRSSTLHELRRLEARLRSDGCRALVIDLRSAEPSAQLTNVRLVADGLLDSGILWRQRNAVGQEEAPRADCECLFRDWPLAVLVDREDVDIGVQALLGALQDNHRSVIVGEKAKAIGLVKSLVDLPNGQGAVSIWVTRLDRATTEKQWPVQPDHIVELSVEQRKAVESWLRQKELTEPPPGADAQAPADPQLARAVEVLQASLKAANRADSR